MSAANRRVAQTINPKTILGAAYAGFACAGLDSTSSQPSAKKNLPLRFCSGQAVRRPLRWALLLPSQYSPFLRFCGSLITPPKSSHPTQLLSRQHFVRVSPLAAKHMNLPASVANKRLTAKLTLLSATLTKNRGVGGPALGTRQGCAS